MNAKHCFLFLFSITLGATAVAEENPDLKALFQQGVFAEEAEQDLEAAAGLYEELLSSHSKERRLAAAAMARLAEIRQGQGESDKAIELLQQIVLGFPAEDPQVQKAKSALADLGVEVPRSEEGALQSVTLSEEEEAELDRLKRLAVQSPDLVSGLVDGVKPCLLYTSPSPRDRG